MERLMRYKTLQCFLAALIMIVFLAPAAYASGTPDAYEASANAVSEKYIGKTVPGACVVISEYDNTVFAKGYGFADLENNTAMDPETTVFEWGSISKTFVWVSVMQLVEDKQGIDPDNIAIKKPVKDWKQGGYLIVVTFNDDINNKYYYHYEVWTHKKGEPLRFNRMTLTIIDEKNSVVLEYPYDGKCKYPPIKE